MSPTQLRRKVIEEIQRLPDEKLSELYNVIHSFRIGVEHGSQSYQDNIMQFAGCWDDMPDHEFDDWLNEISERRSRAFVGRIDRETLVS